MWKSGEPDWPNLYVIDYVCTSIKNENIDVRSLITSLNLLKLSPANTTAYFALFVYTVDTAFTYPAYFDYLAHNSEHSIVMYFC